MNLEEIRDKSLAKSQFYNLICQNCLVFFVDLLFSEYLLNSTLIYLLFSFITVEMWLLVEVFIQINNISILKNQQTILEDQLKQKNSLQIVISKLLILEKLILMTLLVLGLVFYQMKFGSGMEILPFFTLIQIFVRLKVYILETQCHDNTCFFSIVKALISFSISTVVIMLQFKSNNILSVSYVGVFWPLWIVFALSLGIAFSLFMIFANKLFLLIGDGEGSKQEVVGILWMFYLSTQYSSNIYTFIEGVSSMCQYNDLSQLSVNSYTAVSTSAFFIIFSFCFKRYIVGYFILVKTEERLENTSIQQENQQQNADINTEVRVQSPRQKLPMPAFLIKLSGTYFQRGRESQREKIHQLRPNSPSKNSEFTVQNPFTLPENNTIANNTELINQNSNKKINDSLSHYKSIKYKESRNSFIEQKQIKSNHELISKNDEENEFVTFRGPVYQQIQVKEINLNQTVSEPSSIRSQINNCIICYERQPNCVIFECGHGGICVVCGQDIWKTSGECFLCRSPIDQLLQIDVDRPNADNFFNVVGQFTQVQKVKSNENHEFANGF